MNKSDILWGANVGLLRLKLQVTPTNTHRRIFSGFWRLNDKYLKYKALSMPGQSLLWFKYFCSISFKNVSLIVYYYYYYIHFYIILSFHFFPPNLPMYFPFFSFKFLASFFRLLLHTYKSMYNYILLGI